jgi:hypothetical protein
MMMRTRPAGLRVGVGASASRGNGMPSLADLMVTDFEPRGGETFCLRAPDRELALELVEIRRLGDSGREGGAFSLLFRAPSGPFLPQAIYAIEHPALGTLDLFIVPIGPIPGGNGYEAIFT